MNGEGTRVDSVNQKTFRGKFEKNVLKKGTLETQEYTYTGFFDKFEKSGAGKIKYKNSKTLEYDGLWTKDMKNGKGNEIYSNKSSFSGIFKNDIRHG